MSEIRRLVLVPVAEFDRRATRALEYSWRVAATERRAIHVATSESSLWKLGGDWMANSVACPLSVVERDGNVARTIGKVVEYELDSGFDEVVVLLGRLGLSRGVHRVLHDRDADAIADVVSDIPGATVALMTVAMT